VKEVGMTTCTPSGVLATRVGAGCAENPYKCYQCKRCTAGCPVAGFAGLHPAQIMRAVQLGQYDMIFDDKFIWLCTGCETCTTRCPQGIDIAAIMDELKILARQEGRVPADAPFANILRLNYESIKRWGRLYEIELLARDKMTRPSGMMDDVALGIRMFLKGKLNLMPTRGDTMAMERMIKTADAITRARQAGQPSLTGEDAGGAA
jgi:heterodisulfide reductase subunit C